MLTILALLILTTTPSFAGENGTVPIGVTRLPEYADEEPQNDDPVAAPVKSFNLDSASGWYAGDGSAPTSARRPAATVDPTSGKTPVKTGTAATANESQPYGPPIGSGSGSGSGNNANNNKNPDPNAGKTLDKSYGLIDREPGGFTGGIVQGQMRGP